MRSTINLRRLLLRFCFYFCTIYSSSVHRSTVWIQFHVSKHFQGCQYMPPRGWTVYIYLKISFTLESFLTSGLSFTHIFEIASSQASHPSVATLFLTEKFSFTKSSSQDNEFNCINGVLLSVMPLLPSSLQVSPSVCYSFVADKKVNTGRTRGSLRAKSSITP